MAIFYLSLDCLLLQMPEARKTENMLVNGNPHLEKSVNILNQYSPLKLRL